MNSDSGFREFISSPKDEEFISSSCEVIVHQHGGLISVITDAYEGHAMMSLPVAKQLVTVLSRAVHHAEDLRKGK